MHDIMIKAGLSGMQVRILLHDKIRPSNVHDFAVILLAEAKNMFDHLPKSKQIFIPSYYPGYKIPAQVYQRVTILHKQLLMLNKLVKADQFWFKAN